MRVRRADRRTDSQAGRQTDKANVLKTGRTMTCPPEKPTWTLTMDLGRLVASPSFVKRAGVAVSEADETAVSSQVQ